MTAGGQGVFSCVVDADRRFHLQALRWYATLERVVGVDAADLVVHAVGSSDSDILRYLRARGVTVRDVRAFDRRSPHCNKISGALSLAEHRVDGLAVLTDTDVVVLEDARHLPVSAGSVGFRVVGAGNPPLHVLETVFGVAGLPLPAKEPIELAPGEFTLRGHANGGFYVVPGATLPGLVLGWERWARWLLENLALLETWATFLDQVAMTLAIVEGGVRPDNLGLRWNFPSQNPKRIPPDPPVPAAIHYHKQVTEAGTLVPTGIAVVDDRIECANRAIAEVWREALPGPRAAGGCTPGPATA